MNVLVLTMLEGDQKMSKGCFEEFVIGIYRKELVGQLELGNIPWFSDRNITVFGIEDINIISGLPYHGITKLALIMSRASNHFLSYKWVSFRQADSRGWRIGKKIGTPVLYWKPTTKMIKSNVFVGGVTKKMYKNVIGSEGRSYYVYNIGEMGNVPAYQKTTKPVFSDDSIGERCGRIVDDFIDCPTIDNGYEKAAYSPVGDLIGMPRWTDYTNITKYYQALFHELIHSTGNIGRLNRELWRSNTITHLYSEEELIADIGTLFLCSMAGIELPKYIGNRGDYIAYWMPRFRKDKDLLVKVASRASAAVRYVLNEIDIFGNLLS